MERARGGLEEEEKEGVSPAFRVPPFAPSFSKSGGAAACSFGVSEGWRWALSLAKRSAARRKKETRSGTTRKGSSFESREERELKK
jgi:hypothetical protein